jgi:uncharacterized membrane protein
MIARLPLVGWRVSIRPYPAALAAIVAVGVLLRWYGLTTHALSYDESFSAVIVGRSLSDLIRAAAGDVHPPLSYLILWAAVRLAGAINPLTLRIVPALVGSAALLQVLALAGRLKLSPAATLAGLAVFALSPFEIHYSQDARMYALLQCAILGALVAGYDRRWRQLVAWGVALVWLHNYGLIYWAVIGALLLVRELGQPVYIERRVGDWGVFAMPYADLRGLAVAMAVPLVAWLPWAGVLAGQMHSLAAGYWIPPLSLGQFVYPLFPLLWGVALPTRLYNLAAIVGYGALLFGVLKAARLRRQLGLVWLIVGPAALAAAMSLVWHPIYLYRGLIGVLPPLALLIGWAVTEGTGRLERVWAALVIGPLLIAGLINRPAALAQTTGENDRAIQTVLAGWRPGDIVYHGNVGTWTGFEASGPASLENYLMTVQPGSVGVLTPQTRRALGICEGDLTPAGLVTTCGPRPWGRVWLVWGASQTISGAEDAAIARLLAAYPHEKTLDIRDVYHGVQPVEGGIWLLTLP